MSETYEEYMERQMEGVRYLTDRIEETIETYQRFGLDLPPLTVAAVLKVMAEKIELQAELAFKAAVASGDTELW